MRYLSNTDLYFKLTRKQRAELQHRGYYCPTIHRISMSDFKKITKNKELHNLLTRIKRQYIRLVA